MKYVKNLLTILLISVLTFGITFFASNIFQQEALAASISWDGTGDTTSWSDPLNWSTDTVPTDIDDVLIDADVTVNLASGTTVNSLVLGNTGGTTLPNLNFTYDSVGTTDPLIVDVGDLEIYGGGNITHSAGGASIVGSVNIDIQTGDLIVHSDGSIDVSDKGYSPNNGTGAGGNASTGGGGGYGGEGGVSNTGTEGGVTYGSIDNPLVLGSGGGQATFAGHGGGLVKINIANNLSLNGGILANGKNGTNNTLYEGGGGSGGSINITIGNIWSGTGNITSNGGIGGKYLDSAGGGGGGRISVVGYTSKTYSGQIATYGGDSLPAYQNREGKQGGAGTIYLRVSGESGRLTIDNGSNTDRTEAGVTPISYSSNLHSLEISDYAYVDLESNISAANFSTNTNSYIIGDTEITATDISVLGSSYITLSNTVNVGTLEIDGAFLYVESTAIVTYSTFNFTSGELGDGGGTFPYMESSSLSVPSGCTIYADYPRSYTSGMIDGILTHSANGSTLDYKIDYIFSEDLTISDTGSIDLTGKGYSGGEGPGQGTDGVSKNGAGGGAHGGNGGDGESGYLGGTSYDDPNNPQDAGSGGGNGSSSYAPGGGGGGLLLLDIGGTLDVQGSILANGRNGAAGIYGSSEVLSSAGGAGGGINIVTGTLSGDGNIEAKGGLANEIDAGGAGNAYGGGGGGGLIYILYSDNSYSGTTDISGGTGANPGTDGVAVMGASNQAPQADDALIDTPQNLYAGRSYSIDTTYSDIDGQDDLSELYFTIQNPGGDDIEFKVDYSAVDLEDQIPEVLAGSSYIENVTYSIFPSYGTNFQVKVTWKFDIGWTWTQNSNIEYGVQAIDTSAVSSNFSYTDDDYVYKNVLEFRDLGSMRVTDALGNPIGINTWLAPNATVNWTGYKIVYDNELEVYADPDDYNVKLTDEMGRFWLDGGGVQGEDFNITTSALDTTVTGYVYRLTIVDVPTGGSSTDFILHILNVDADKPIITSLNTPTHPDENQWYSANELNVQWQTSDSHSGVASTYRYISQNSNESSSTVQSKGALTSLKEWTSNALSDGIYYFYLLVKDLVGNESIQSRTVRIDSKVPDIVDITGAYENQWQNIDSGPTISWTDPKSVSDDTFYITTNGSTPSSSNFRYATNQTSYDLPSLGNGEHTVKVRAKSGVGIYSSTRSFVIKYDSIPTNAVTNFEISSEENGEVQLRWVNPTNSDFSKVRLYRNDGLIYTGNLESYKDTLEREGVYKYSIYAYDFSNNRSQGSTVEIEYVPEVEEVEEDEDVVIVKENKSSERVKEGDKSQIILGESVEIQIPVKKILGDYILEDSDTVILKVDGEEYPMGLSADGRYFSTRFNAPQTEGDHIIYAIATRDGQVLSQYDINLEVVDENRGTQTDAEPISNISNMWVWISIAVLSVLTVIFIVTLIIKKSPKV